MVTGLERFRDHFREHTHQFALIGGTACDLIMEEAGLTFRATRDLDIVLLVEQLDPSFFAAFWEFVRGGAYRIQQAASGRPRLYRFAEPMETGYPFMLELFSIRPEFLEPGATDHLTPIPTDSLASSLSAILLDESYYSFLKNGIRSIDGVPVVGAEHLIPLKARAWLDMGARKDAGEKVDSRAVRKHKNDVFRLSTVVDPTFTQEVPKLAQDDMRRFVSSMREEAIDFKNLGLGGLDLGTVLQLLESLYVRD